MLRPPQPGSRSATVGSTWTAGGAHGGSDSVASAAAIAAVVSGRSGTSTFVVEKSKTSARSPHVSRRHALRLGTSTPNRVSMRRSIDVWSNTPLCTRPPVVQGEAMMVGTRNPSPIAVPCVNSPGVPGGGVGGTTWSKYPPFSS